MKITPFRWIMHGNDDSTVPVRGSDKFVQHLRQSLPGVSVRYDVVSGQDHGFDFNEENWDSIERDALKFVGEAWL